ncbi:hypothetical protein XELAEV_18003247mg [Xenopus laevis]|uniref:Helix-turn-helix domain-containing protein n=1 Tax=Xenopus laevis TaxID=8355 RepID=A0A974GZ11_XENLA|nr:hypothetical protein XELAEV_18003247mg [Xenopus laevis]
MGYWEELHIQPSLHPQTGLLKWKRYIDDCIFIWQGSEESLSIFLKQLNVNNFNINFTSDISKKSVNFLDLVISVENEQLITSLYRKPTDTNGFILNSSCHHKKWLNNIPLSQFNRAKRNCSRTIDYEKECQVLQNQFREKGYKENIIMEAKKRCDQMNRKDMLENTKNKKSKINNDHISFITTYNQSKNKFEKILKKHWHILRNDKDLSNYLTKNPRILYKKPQTIKQILVPSCIPVEKKQTRTFLTQDTVGFYPCGNCKACKTCQTTNKKCKSYTSKVTNMTYNIKSFITCSSTNIIYLLECPCGLQYVGRTGRSLKTRLREHIYNIKKGVMTHSVSAHFTSYHNSDPSLLSFMGIVHKKAHWRGSDIINLISREETTWIHKLQTLAPKGLNIEIDLKCFLTG